MVAVFLTTNAQSPERMGMAFTAIAAWQRNPHVWLAVLDAGADPILWEWLAAKGIKPARYGLEPKGSQRERHVVARGLLRAELYRAMRGFSIITDDDIIPQQGDAWIRRAIDHLEAPAPVPWGLVAAWLPEAVPSQWPRPSTRRPIADQGAVGGLRFVRVEALKHLPDYQPTGTRRGYDPPLCTSIRQHGFGVGIFTDPLVRATHAGQDYSSVHPHEMVEGQPTPR